MRRDYIVNFENNIKGDKVLSVKMSKLSRFRLKFVTYSGADTVALRSSVTVIVQGWLIDGCVRDRLQISHFSALIALYANEH